MSEDQKRRRKTFSALKEMFNVLYALARDTSSANGSPIASPASSSRDGLITTVYKLHRTRARILEPYRRLKRAIIKMQDEYLQSKENNIFVRYSKMQQSILEVVMLEKQYWTLINVPQQEPSENQMNYVLRVVNLLEERGPAYPVIKTGGIASLLGATLNIAEKTKDQNTYEAIKYKPTDQLRRECDVLYNEVYKLIRKYLNLRSVVQELTEKYQSSRFYPIIPRYLFLKNFIKQVLRNPAFSEIAHEASE
ncbi:hypothetical protein M3Y97_00736600 [Aphelenchoides bicaudatus]|nr:hypothetical protein M3Y97_00736600 [Aphelenchoides bicaudatus]